MLFYLLFQGFYLGVVYQMMSATGLGFAIAIAVVFDAGDYQLYRTLRTERKKLSSGRYERVQAHHSWNSNHVIGRMVLYELTRHSDHHYRANKKVIVLMFQSTIFMAIGILLLSPSLISMGGCYLRRYQAVNKLRF